MDSDFLVFALNNTDNSYQAAVLADRLEEEVTKATPKVALPLDWVQENAVGPVKRACFAAANCNDPATLEQIARRERRISVLQALVGNRHLPQYAFDDVLANSGLTGRALDVLRSIRDDATTPPDAPRDPSVFFWDDPANYAWYHNDSVFVERMLQLRSVTATDPSAPTRVLEKEPGNNTTMYALSYLKSRYLGTEFDDVWAHVTRTPREILDDYEDTDLLDDFLQALLYSTTSKELIDTDLAEAMTLTLEIELNGECFDSWCPPRDIFTPAATAWLLDAAALETALALLSYQVLSDEQFTDLLHRRGAGPDVPSEPYVALFFMIDSKRHRLGELVALLTDVGPRRAARVLNEDHWQEALRALTDPYDELLIQLLPFSTSNTVERYLSAEFILGGSVRIYPLTAVVPPRHAIPAIVRKYRDQLKWASSTLHDSCDTPPEGYVEALIDLCPGLACDFMDHQYYGAYVYSRLTASGLDIDTVLTVFEKNQAKTLNSIIDVLTKMSARTEQPVLVRA